jgi:hypothetical protein
VPERTAGLPQARLQLRQGDPLAFVRKIFVWKIFVLRKYCSNKVLF